MEATKSECATDVLVDLSDAITCINGETTSSIAHQKNKAVLDIGVTSDKNCGDQSALNASSSRIYEDLIDFKLKADAVKEPKLNEVSYDCPTGILIDFPCSQNFHLKERNEHAQSDLDSERKFSSSSEKNYSREDSDNIAPSPSEGNNQMLTSRLRWKTPSPKSMSRISKEASKVVQHLNLSDIFNEDDLLTEEILPIPINFDIFDTDDTSNEKKPSSPNSIKINDKLSVNVQIQDAVNDKAIEKEKIGSCDIDSNSPHDVSSKNLNERCVQLPSKTCIEMNTKNSKDEECDKRDINLSTGSDCVDDVFIMTSVPAEDKENIHRKGNKLTLLKKKTTGNKPLSPFTPNKKSNYLGTLKNVSNIKHEVNSPKYLNSSLDKKENTPLKKTGIGLKSKTVQPLPLKSKIKRTVLSDTSDQKLNTSIKDFSFMSNPVCNSSSSAARQQNACPQIKTPLRRYSVCTPLKRPSSVNPVTPASRFQNCDISRFTPQSARASLSFSRSCQQFSKPFSVAKNINSALPTVPVGNVRESLGRINSSKREVPSFSKSTSSISFQSLKRNSMYSSSKEKFCSKLSLPSPLPAEQQKKIVRNLFPSAPKRKN